MSMNQIRTIEKVVELALQRRDNALAQLAQLQREMQQAQDQMDQLSNYAREAQERWHARSLQGVDANLLHHHRQFMFKIEHAMDFQRSVLSSRQEQIDKSQAQLHEAERDLAGLRKYHERKQHEIDQRQQRQDQKSMDEMAQNVYLMQLRRQNEGVRP